jgi:3-methylcrotonyl-CoA carboxylase alpha subunit
VFNKILIANRGEIACRIIKTARRLGIQSVAVFSDADANALHVSMADEAIHIGASASSASYLRMDKIIAAAIATDSQAIHPGYGFLSENSNFCQLCVDNNIVFIGPPIAAIEAMGSKSKAKSIMEQSAVPLVPGYHGNNQNPDFLKKTADAMGYPILLKAAAGGGGKGMRQVDSSEDFDEALVAAKRESMNAFNDDIMLIEKYLIAPRHVEIQVFCDQHNNAVYLAERDCSVQRRHQKVIEEAPAPGMTEQLRKKMGEVAINAARAIHYEGAGTVEFLLAKDDSFYFMEMNTRLQVEHPVTEMITGQDLVEWQFRVAAGETLPLQQQHIKINGHAFEARIYAEDPDNDFLPATGHLNFVQTPIENKHIRIDTGVRQGDDISVYYDPMIAKLIAWGTDRKQALQRLKQALKQYHIVGVTTNLRFLYNLADATPFAQAQVDTSFIDKNASLLFKKDEYDSKLCIPLAALAIVLNQQKILTKIESDPYSPWQLKNAWRSCEAAIQTLRLRIGNQEIIVAVEHPQQNNSRYTIQFEDHSVTATGDLKNNLLRYCINGYQSEVTISHVKNYFSLFTQKGLFEIELVDTNASDKEINAQSNRLTAPMNGTIIDVIVQTGQQVKRGDSLIVMEAMKMEHVIRAPSDGVIQQIFFHVNDLVDGDTELLRFEEE